MVKNKQWILRRDSGTETLHIKIQWETSNRIRTCHISKIRDKTQRIETHTYLHRQIGGSRI